MNSSGNSSCRYRIARHSALIVAGTLMATMLSSGPIAALDQESAVKQLGDFSVRGIRKHQQAWQRIADKNDDNRAAGTNGYDQSVHYVRRVLEKVGYQVTVQNFEFIAFDRLGPSTLEQTAPDTVVYKELDEEGGDYALMNQTDAGDVTATVTAVDLALDDPASSTSGCEVEDFVDFPAGNIALVQRGACTFQAKAENAAAAGAVGTIIFNQGDSDDPARQDAFSGTLSAEYSGGIPVFGAGFGLGSSFAGIEGLTLRMVADTERVPTTTDNVLAERPGGAPADAPVIVIGGHLDSVPEGPGINDNGSGSGVILEIARQMAKLDIITNNRVRFAWWGAEEAGLIGSSFYTANLSEEEIAEIAVYLNLDMVGSPNYVRFVYDGDGSDTDDGGFGSAESGLVEQLFLDHFANASLPIEPTPFNGRSDYVGFVQAGIPAGGLFSGAEGVKTDVQVEVYGGTAGEQYDPCYHEACDTFDNNSNEVLAQFTRATATVLAILAFEDLPLTAPETAAVARVQAAAAAERMEYRGHYLVR